MKKRHLLLAVSLFLFSGIARAQNNYTEISLTDLLKKAAHGGLDYIILDVRSPGEYVDTTNNGKHAGIGRIKTAINIPIQDFLQNPETVKKLDDYKNKDIYVICSHSYRSRRVSNLLLENGFLHVNNVKGGMSEWYRNYDELKSFMPAMYENTIPFQNMAPSQFFSLLQSKKPVEVIAFSNPPRFWYDSVSIDLYQHFPEVQNTTYLQFADSLQVLEKAKAAHGNPVVLFTTVGNNPGEIAEWLTAKGIPNVHQLIGGLNGFYEYIANYQPPSAIKKYLVPKTAIEFFTPLSFCKNTPANFRWIDIRHDTTFNQLTNGTKLDYKTLKGAVNFPFYKDAGEFANQFPDKSKLYMLLSENGFTGFELADDLIKKGYKIGWLLGGIERWEWYTNNIDIFICKDQFVK